MKDPNVNKGRCTGTGWVYVPRYPMKDRKDVSRPNCFISVGLLAGSPVLSIS